MYFFSQAAKASSRDAPRPSASSVSSAPKKLSHHGPPPATATAKKGANLTAKRKEASNSSSSSSSSNPLIIDEEANEKEMAEYKEKERLIQALAECDDHIKKFESVLLNLHNGKVKKKLFIFIFVHGSITIKATISFP